MNIGNDTEAVARKGMSAVALRRLSLTFSSRRARQIVAALCSVLLCMAGASSAMQDEDATRGLWDTAFLQKRPAAKTAANRTRQIRYRSVGAPKVTNARYLAARDSVVGVTVWRLRPSAPTDEVRQLVHDAEGEWTPERISFDAPLQEGQHVQITIEAPRAGYLYVFDREMYIDKTYGDPYLIFPTTAIRGGDNKVMAGRVVEIPSPEDEPPYYTLKGNRPDYAGEVLTVLITDRPLAELAIGRKPLKLPEAQVAAYEKRWGAVVDNLELVGGAGSPMTLNEKAAAKGNRLLTRADSLPQTLYRIRSKPGAPLLLSVPLRVRAGD
ncbi:MAG TPA: DUF4384 domain-containing protein [Pyrinomonadaceae bacterium]|nr:DUF4384 domain-containing protein [Pyrinomonadaceae bacterium]